jgi:hypothetical protein
MRQFAHFDEGALVGLVVFSSTLTYHEIIKKSLKND